MAKVRLTDPVPMTQAERGQFKTVKRARRLESCQGRKCDIYLRADLDGDGRKEVLKMHHNRKGGRNYLTIDGVRVGGSFDQVVTFIKVGPMRREDHIPEDGVRDVVLVMNDGVRLLMRGEVDTELNRSDGGERVRVPFPVSDIGRLGRTVHDFEDDIIEGSLVRPEGDYLQARERGRGSALIRVRDNFVPEMLLSAEDL